MIPLINGKTSHIDALILKGEVAGYTGDNNISTRQRGTNATVKHHILFNEPHTDLWMSAIKRAMLVKMLHTKFKRQSMTKHFIKMNCKHHERHKECVARGVRK